MTDLICKSEDNPPAFPTSTERQVFTPAGEFWPGMTLRDYFAVHCPITMSEAQKTLDDEGAGFVSYGKIYKRLAQMQLAYADALLQERETYGKPDQ